MRMLLRWAFYTIGIPNLIKLCVRDRVGRSLIRLYSTKQTGRIIGRGGFLPAECPVFLSA